MGSRTPPGRQVRVEGTKAQDRGRGLVLERPELGLSGTGGQGQVPKGSLTLTSSKDRSGRVLSREATN